jgi:rubrerythrin
LGKQKNDPIEALQSVLRGEFMAISVYDAVLSTIESPQLKRQLEEVRDDHQRHAQQISLQIQELGGEPIDGAGLGGWMARAGIRMRGWYDHDPRSMLRQVYDGEDQGIAATIRVTRDKLDERSQALIERIMSEDRDHLGLLEHEIAKQTSDLQ